MRKEKASLAFVTNGGAGTLFIQANFIYHVSRYLQDEPVRIIVFAHKSKDLNDAVFSGQDFCDEYFPASERHRALSDYDVSVNLNFYPEILVIREERLSACPRLLHLMHGWQSFLAGDVGRTFYASHFGLDINGQILAIVQGKNCLNILDVTNELGVSRDYALSLILNKAEAGSLSQWGLQKDEYITLQRGAYPTLNVREVPKIWPLEHYTELVRLLKKCFPEKKIVQLGESEEHCCHIPGVDLSLVGKTDWEDLKVLLKNAWLHIDGECGMVHLRKMLHGGPSVVLFGPTPVDFYGYDGNINISSDACPHWCCKLMESTAERCVLEGEDSNRCIRSIHPFQVLDRIIEWDYTMNLKRGGAPLQGVCLEDLEQEGICFDDDFSKNILPGRYVYYYEIKETLLRDLHIVFREKNVVTKRPLEKSPAYLLLQGNPAEYLAGLEREKKLCYVEHHDVRQFRKLRESIEKQYDDRYKIVIWPDLRIYDGHHRASVLLWRNGKDCTAEVLVLYSIVLFPFHKVKPGSRIIIYGLGEIGEAYLRQIRLSQYVTVVRIVDRHADRFKNNEEELGVEVKFPESLSKNPVNYDHIVLALGNPKNIMDVKNALINQGISQIKIVAQDGMIYI